MGLFARIKDGLKKTRQIFNTDLRDLFKGEGRLVDDEFLKELFAVLVKTDMGGEPASRFRDRVAKEFRGRVIALDDMLTSIKAELHELISQAETPLHFAESGPTIIMVVGVNGSGKTTSIAKLAYRLHAEGKKVVLGAGDTFRAAAVSQLSVWADRIGCQIIKGKQGGDPASVAYATIARALEINADVAIIDTAGRLQTQSNLMQELEKIRRVMGKQIPEAPHQVLLVLDATAGQNAISQAKGFSEVAHCTGLILAKLDGTAKGGVVIPIIQQFALPVQYIGVGEQLEDLDLFDSQQFVEALFDGLG